MKKYLDEVTKKCARPKRLSKHHSQNYYNSKLECLGMTVPEVRFIYKNGFSFSDLPQNEKFKIWSYIFKTSNIFEVKSLCIHFVDSLKETDLLKHWPKYKTWVKYIDNWAHSDGYSSTIARLLELDQKTIFPTLKKWNTSKNPWERRQSLVGLFYYSSSRKKTIPLNLALPLVQKRIKDDHYYVQKGVGWTLREIGNLDQKVLVTFLQKNIKVLSSVAFTTSIEKLSLDQKTTLKNARK